MTEINYDPPHPKCWDANTPLASQIIEDLEAGYGKCPDCGRYSRSN